MYVGFAVTILILLTVKYSDEENRNGQVELKKFISRNTVSIGKLIPK